jgi:hypothetical protein
MPVMVKSRRRPKGLPEVYAITLRVVNARSPISALAITRRCSCISQGSLGLLRGITEDRASGKACCPLGV